MMIKQHPQTMVSDSNPDDQIYYSEEDEVQETIPLKAGDMIQNRFVIEELIGEGSFGQVFKTIDQKQSSQPLAVKVEDENEETSMLEREIKVLIELRKKPGFPQIKFYGQERGFIYCIMTLLGKNLESLVRQCGGSFTVPTVLKIALQILTRIEVLHTCRFVHRDIKPDNFVLGLGNQINVVHLIDFGLSKYYMNSKNNHIPQVKKAGLIGTARYASINAHEEQEQGRKDDLESIGYILIYLATGNLPWMNLAIEQKDLKYAKIYQLKKSLKIDQLCGKLPKCFHNYMNQVKSLQFKDTPNYKDLKQLFQDDLDKCISYAKAPIQFDWEKLPEYQQKKKHMTVHLMQPNIRDEEIQLEKVEQDHNNEQTQKLIPQRQQSPIKNKPSLRVEVDKFKQIMERNSPLRKKQSMASPTRKKKSPVMINVIGVHESQPDETNPQSNVQFQRGSYLVPPQQASLKYIEQYPQSIGSSKMINYERSEAVESEGSLPIWNVEKSKGILSLTGGLSHQMPTGIKRPRPQTMIIRKNNKSLTCNLYQNRNNFQIEVQALKNISKTFIQPSTSKVIGDSNDFIDID